MNETQAKQVLEALDEHVKLHTEATERRLLKLAAQVPGSQLAAHALSELATEQEELNKIRRVRNDFYYEGPHAALARVEKELSDGSTFTIMGRDQKLVAAEQSQQAQIGQDMGAEPARD